MDQRRYAIKSIAAHLKALEFHIRRVHSLDDTEPLHRVRTVSRRLRNILWIFKNLFPKKDLKRWDKAIGRVSRACGEARDLDVQIFSLADIKRAADDKTYRQNLEVLQDDLKKMRRKFQSQVLRAVGRLKKLKTLAEVRAYLKCSSHFKDDKKSDKLRRTAARRVGARLKTLLDFAGMVNHPERSVELHQMRIAAKHLRYTLESLHNLYGPAVGPFIDAVLKIHRSLGELHDMDMWLARLPHFAVMHKKDAEFKKMIARLVLECKSRRKKAYQTFRKAWTAHKRRHVWAGLVRLILK